MQTHSPSQEAEFISLISHAFRSLLGKTKWYIEEIKGAKEIQQAPSDIQSALDYIDGNNERLLSLVSTVLAVSHIDHGTIRLLPQKTDMVRTIEDSIKRMTLRVKRNGITVAFLHPGSFPPLMMDKVKLQEIIEHVIENAIVYNNLKGTVNISLVYADEKVTMNIADTGIGISEADQPNIFTKFFRTEQGARLNPEGSGLGLYVVKAYMMLFGGTITIESIVDTGTRVTLTIPISPRNTSYEERREDNAKNTHY